MKDLISRIEEKKIFNMRDNLISRIEEIYNMRKSDKGKYRVIGVDKFDDSDWIHGEYNTAKEAIKEAEKLTKECMKHASGGDIATVYYAYDPEGNYLGGDVWNDAEIDTTKLDQTNR